MVPGAGQSASISCRDFAQDAAGNVGGREVTAGGTRPAINDLETIPAAARFMFANNSGI
jgi:hypothetical protein